MTYVQIYRPHEYNLWRNVHPLLSHLDIELTERCNNSCLHCLINQSEYDTVVRAREMDTTFVKNILQQGADLGCLTVRFTGGEPLLRDDFSELYLFTRRLGMRVILFTNARLITPELAQLMACIPPGRVVEVTVYGMHAESYDAAAGVHGGFAEFWQGIELLRKYEIPFIVKQSILPPNRNEIIEFEAFASTLSKMGNKPGYSMNFDLRARRDNPVKNRLIQTLRLTPDETVAILSRNPNYVKGMRKFCGKFMRSPGDKLFNCGAGHGTCIDAYGNAQMCMGLRHPGTVYNLRIGNYFEEQPDRIIEDSENMAKQSPTSNVEIALQNQLATFAYHAGASVASLKYALTEFFPRLRALRAENPDYLSRCARCFLKGLCEQCPAKSWAEHGTLDTPVEYLCDVAHAQARYLGLLGTDEHAWEINGETSQKRVTRFMGEN
jgi:MoaA/NifB/PqqE/SkfB family radical SAM enzyme